LPPEVICGPSVTELPPTDGEIEIAIAIDICSGERVR